MPDFTDESVLTRLSVLEAKVRLISLVLKGAVALIATALAGYLIGGCSSLPPREVYVAWNYCGKGADVRRVLFVDTMTPTLDCIRASQGADRAGFVLLTLLGMPVTACTNTVLGRDYATIYAPISPSPTQIAVALGTMRPMEDVVQHELEHAFSGPHHGGCQ